MSPEQADGRRVDARTDIFSFGAVLYEMITGRRAFAGSSSLSILAKILNEDPAPPRTLDATTPGMLAIESYDGADLYYVESTQSNAPGTLWRLPLKGGAPTRLVDGAFSTSFEVVDRGIYYMDLSSGETRLRYFDFATHHSTLVTANPAPVSAGLAASRDGRTVLYSRVDSSVNDLMLVENFR